MRRGLRGHALVRQVQLLPARGGGGAVRNGHGAKHRGAGGVLPAGQDDGALGLAHAAAGGRKQLLSGGPARHGFAVLILWSALNGQALWRVSQLHAWRGLGAAVGRLPARALCGAAASKNTAAASLLAGQRQRRRHCGGGAARPSAAGHGAAARLQLCRPAGPHAVWLRQCELTPAMLVLWPLLQLAAHLGGHPSGDPPC